MADEEQVEQLKKWWRENGRTVVAGLVIGLGGVSGWTWWQAHTQRQAEHASELYTALMSTAASERHDEARQQADQIVEQFPGSGYATLASLVAAASAAAAERNADAQARLTWVVDNGSRPEYRELARVRLARLQLGDASYEQALQTLASVGSSGLSSVVDELRADILVAKGEQSDARAAYSAVLEDGELPVSARIRVQMKLDDLGHLSVP